MQVCVLLLVRLRCLAGAGAGAGFGLAVLLEIQAVYVLGSIDKYRFNFRALG